MNEVFPAVFLTKSVMRRLFDEICKHHRYLGLLMDVHAMLNKCVEYRYLTLLTASGINGDSKRILTGDFIDFNGNIMSKFRQGFTF